MDALQLFSESYSLENNTVTYCKYFVLAVYIGMYLHVQVTWLHIYLNLCTYLCASITEFNKVIILIITTFKYIANTKKFSL